MSTPSHYQLIESAKTIAAMYENAVHDPYARLVQGCYEHFIKETIDQYKEVERVLHVRVIDGTNILPYVSSEEMREELSEGILRLLMTGNKDLPGGHPLNAFSNFILPGGVELRYNDIFRIVHDVYGHGSGAGFGFIGEVLVFNLHKKLYSREAIPALTTETLAQNCWVNYGIYGEFNRKHPNKTIYADQKACILPDWVSEVMDF